MMSIFQRISKDLNAIAGIGARCFTRGHRDVENYPLRSVANPPSGKHRTQRWSIRLLTRLRVVDNSAIGKQAMAEGKPPKIIHIYRQKRSGTMGELGDKVLVAIKGEMKRGIVVGVRRNQPAMVPKMDSNNVVLIDDNGSPLGTRIHAPVPMMLRTLLKRRTFSKGPDYTKLLAIATRFI